MKWILRPILPLVLSIAAIYLFQLWFRILTELKFHSSAPIFAQLLGLCSEYAKNNNQKYPDGKSSNEAFRQFFISGYIDDVIKLFTSFDLVPQRPDGAIGTKEDGFIQALTPGECQLNYIRGLTTEADRLTPLLFMQVVGSDGEIYMLGARVGQHGTIYPTTNGAVLEEHEGKTVDIFSDAYLNEKYGIEPQDILKPEGPPRDVIAMAKARKQHLHALEAGILALIWLPFLLTVWIKHRRKAKTPPEKPVLEV